MDKAIYENIERVQNWVFRLFAMPFQSEKKRTRVDICLEAQMGDVMEANTAKARQTDR